MLQTIRYLNKDNLLEVLQRTPGNLRILVGDTPETLVHQAMCAIFEQRVRDAEVDNDDPLCRTLVGMFDVKPSEEFVNYIMTKGFDLGDTKRDRVDTVRLLAALRATVYKCPMRLMFEAHPGFLADIRCSAVIDFCLKRLRAEGTSLGMVLGEGMYRLFNQFLGHKNQAGIDAIVHQCDGRLPYDATATLWVAQGMLEIAEIMREDDEDLVVTGGMLRRLNWFLTGDEAPVWFTLGPACPKFAVGDDMPVPQGAILADEGPVTLRPHLRIMAPRFLTCNTCLANEDMDNDKDRTWNVLHAFAGIADQPVTTPYLLQVAMRACLPQMDCRGFGKTDVVLNLKQCLPRDDKDKKEGEGESESEDEAEDVAHEAVQVAVRELLATIEARAIEDRVTFARRW